MVVGVVDAHITQVTVLAIRIHVHQTFFTQFVSLCIVSWQLGLLGVGPSPLLVDLIRDPWIAQESSEEAKQAEQDDKESDK